MDSKSFKVLWFVYSCIRIRLAHDCDILWLCVKSLTINLVVLLLIFSGWQPRWFVLDNGVLVYYKSQEEVSQGCKGSLKISACEISGNRSVGVKHWVITINIPLSQPKWSVETWRHCSWGAAFLLKGSHFTRTTAMACCSWKCQSMWANH